MSDVIVGPNGELEIPKDIVQALNVLPGDLVSFSVLHPGVVYVIAKNRSIQELAGALYREGQQPLPIERMSPWD